jgi:hypothetical protein
MNSEDQFAGLEIMCRERAALAKKEWNTGWQKQRNGSSLGNLLTHSQKDASPRPRVISDPIINRLDATAPPKVPGHDSAPPRADLLNRYIAKNWNAAMTRGPITFPGSCCNNPTPASSNCMKPANVPNMSNAGSECL